MIYHRLNWNDVKVRKSNAFNACNQYIINAKQLAAVLGAPQR
jgi:hypothetical protein